MMMVAGEKLAKLNLVFPADIDPPYDTEFFKQIDGSVDADAVDLVF